MKQQGLTYVGITGHTKDGSQYLSLFGDKINTKTTDGQTNLIAEMVSNIDRAIINSYEADFFNDSANRDPFDKRSNKYGYFNAGNTNYGK